MVHLFRFSSGSVFSYFLQTQHSIYSCKMTIDEETTVESLDSGDRAYAVGLENKLQESDEDAKSRMTGQRKRRAPKGKGKGTKKMCQTNDVGEPSEAFQQPDSAMELESQQQACDIVQGRAKNKMKKLIPIRPRKQQSPNELPKAKGKGKGHQTFDVSQPPEPMGKEKPVRVLFINENKSPQAVRKILMDRVNRRRNIDKVVDMEICIQLWKLVIKHKIVDLFLAIVKSLEKISKEWPPRSDLVDVLQHIEEERAMSKHSTVDEKLIQRFEAIEQEIKKLDENRAKDFEKVAKLAEIICDKGLSMETLRKELSTLAPWLFFEENATNESPKGNIPEGISATELSAAFPWIVLEENPTYEIPGDVGEETLPIELPDYETAVILLKDMEDLDEELFDKKNIKVEVSDFHGLQDAIKGARDGIPDHLKSIVMKIEQDRDEPTPANPFYQQLLVLVSAAVKEMQELPDNELNKTILHKWAATFNLAKEMQFQVPFFKNLLIKNMHAYLHYSRMNSG